MPVDVNWKFDLWWGDQWRKRYKQKPRQGNPCQGGIFYVEADPELFIRFEGFDFFFQIVNFLFVFFVVVIGGAVISRSVILFP